MRQLMLPAVFLVLVASAHAQDEPERPKEIPKVEVPRAEAHPSHDSLRLAFNFYNQADGGGNPNLKEDMTVLEPQVFLSKTAGPWTFNSKFQSDIISAASLDKDYRFAPGTQSGASGDKYFGIDGGAFYAWSDRTTVGGGASFSTEYDYQSIGAYAKWQHSTPSQNDTFVARLSAYFDTLDLILFDGSEEGSDDRRSLSFGLGWTHVIGPVTVLTANYDLTTQSGFLSTPYNSVFAAGTEVREVLPDTRLRHALHVRVKHLLWTDVAIEPGLGLYTDDWGATSANVELAVYWEAMPGSLILRPSYRFHTQTEVDDFLSTSAATIPEFRTQDSDLADFTSHTFGLRFILPSWSLLSKAQDIEFGLDYSMRSDNLDAWSTTICWTWRY